MSALTRPYMRASVPAEFGSDFLWKRCFFRFHMDDVAGMARWRTGLVLDALRSDVRFDITYSVDLIIAMLAFAA